MNDDVYISNIANIYILISKDEIATKSVIANSLLGKSNKNTKITINTMNTDLKRICKDNVITIDEEIKTILKKYRII